MFQVQFDMNIATSNSNKNKTKQKNHTAIFANMQHQYKHYSWCGHSSIQHSIICQTRFLMEDWVSRALSLRQNALHWKQTAPPSPCALHTTQTHIRLLIFKYALHKIRVIAIFYSLWVIVVTKKKKKLLKDPL